MNQRTPPNEPVYRTHEEFVGRSAKLAHIRGLGIDPYPALFQPTHHTKRIAEIYDDNPIGTSEEAARGATDRVTLAGRLVLFRPMGKNAFAHIQDETGRLQIMCNRDVTKVAGLPPEETALKFIEKRIDLGDILGVEGHLFRTHTGELTLFAHTVTLLCKTLLPLPDKHGGLADKGVLYRKRWLDLITHPEVAQRFRLRSQILQLIRGYFEQLGFIEVQTPILQHVYGGAEARPFTTSLLALHQEMFLRISLEIPLKKLIVGGMGRVFEIGSVFRNEGIDRTHNPEFTTLEAYGAWLDYNDAMGIVETLFEQLALKLFGTTAIHTHMGKGDEPICIDLKTPWKRMSMKQSLRTYGNLDVDACSDAQMQAKLLGLPGVTSKDVESKTRGQLLALLFEHLVEAHLIEPHHIIDHPIETTPLCKPHRDPTLRREGFVERFESFIAGCEFSNCYSELNDPELQRELLVAQALQKERGNEEANPLDEEFIEAICQGMPPTGGIGIGIDRLVMLFTGVHSIRDVLLFPLMAL